MVYKANVGWVYSHQCSDKHKRIEGPFTQESDADAALANHKEKCNG